MIAQPVRDPFAPQLHSVFEAERAGCRAAFCAACAISRRIRL